MLNEDKLDNIVVDFAELRNNQLNESFLAAFGNSVKLILNRIFGQGGKSFFAPTTIKVRGTRAEVSAFAKALGGEKKYIEAVRKHGLDDPKVTSNKAKLNKAVKAFERTTGIKWPFK
tara:strand:+ start:439 stop:789 length:351 start_codon:yes stop_codon:yes gene_type:complete